MITIDLLPNRIEMRAYGALTLADLKSFEEESDYRIRFNNPIDVLLDLRNMTQCTLDAALEELRYVRAHPTDFRRVAVLSTAQLVSLGAWITQFFSDADFASFADEHEARRWLEEAADIGPRHRHTTTTQY